MGIEFLYSTGVPVVIGFVLFWLGSRTQKAADPDGQGSRRGAVVTLAGVGLIVVGVVLGVIRLAQVQEAIGPPPVVITETTLGRVEDSEYKNHYFGVRLPFPPGWEDVTAETRKRLPAGNAVDSGERVALALQFNGAADLADSVTVVVAVATFPSRAGATTPNATEYVRRMIREFEERPDPPLGVSDITAEQFAGTDWARVTVRRPWQGGEFPITFWVTTRGSHVLVISASAAGPRGIQVAEDLLGGATQVRTKA